MPLVDSLASLVLSLFLRFLGLLLPLLAIILTRAIGLGPTFETRVAGVGVVGLVVVGGDGVGLEVWMWALASDVLLHPAPPRGHLRRGPTSALPQRQPEGVLR